MSSRPDSSRSQSAARTYLVTNDGEQLAILIVGLRGHVEGCQGSSAAVSGFEDRTRPVRMRESSRIQA